jgi:cytochrome c-type biogenesis protein CcmH/NrfG
MMTWMAGLRLRIWLIVGLSLTVAACGAKTAAPIATTPLFPQYEFPAVPDALEASSHGASEAHREAWSLLQGGNARAAAKKFSTVVKDTPAFYPADAGLGYTSMAQHDYKSAVSEFDKALSASPDYLPALLGRAEALEASNQIPDAVAALDAVLRVDPSRTDLKTRADSLRFRGIEDLVAQARRSQQGGRLDDARGAWERAIQFSPDSAFLYRELAVVERQSGNLDRAEQQVQTALRLDPKDAASHVLAAEIADARGNLQVALDEYKKAQDAGASSVSGGTAGAAGGTANVGNAGGTTAGGGAAGTSGSGGAGGSTDIDTRIHDLERRLAIAAMPEAYRAINTAPQITRADLAALIGVRLESWLTQLPQVTPALMTDVRDNWATPWILTVTRAGLMEVYPNHTFQPDAVIQRADLARIVSRALNLLATQQHNDALAQRWRQAQPTFNDLPPTHDSYPAAALAVAAGVLQNGADNNFQPTKPVSGNEALTVVGRLEAMTGHP